jgi:transcriptional regulator of acetoin/glycerol metabolism
LGRRLGRTISTSTWPIGRVGGPDGRPWLHPDRLLWLATSSSPGEFLGLSDALRAELTPAAPERGAEPPERGAEPPGREAIVAALAAAGGKPSLAAEALGLSSRFVLVRLMKKYGVAGGED